MSLTVLLDINHTLRPRDSRAERSAAVTNTRADPGPSGHASVSHYLTVLRTCSYVHRNWKE